MHSLLSSQRADGEGRRDIARRLSQPPRGMRSGCSGRGEARNGGGARRRGGEWVSAWPHSSGVGMQGMSAPALSRSRSCLII
jgi:hypothetical protein